MGASFPPASPATLTPFPAIARVLKSGVDPKRHLRAFLTACRAGSAKVITNGCSIATQNANNAIADSENFFGAISRTLAKRFPNVAITMQDLSIGGTTYTDLAGTPNFAGGITAPPWYSSQGQPWRTYVNNAAPDLSFLLMDTNDSNGVAGNQIKQVLANYNTLTNLPKPPSIVLVTGTGHTKNGIAQSFIDGILQSAALTRSVAACGSSIQAFYGLANPVDCGLIDLNRYDAMARLGIDPCTQYLTIAMQGVAQTLPCTLPQCDGDFDLQFTLTGTMNSGTQIKIFCGSTVASGSQVPVITITNTGACATVYAGPGAGSLTGTQISWPSSPLSVQVNCRQERVRVIINNQTVMNASVPRSGYQFTPQITVTNATPTLSVDRYSPGTCVGFQSLATDFQVYSDGSILHDGNGVNHHDNRGVANVILPTVEATDFGSIGSLPATGLVAAGTTQATATLVWSPLNIFSTVASGSGCILNPAVVDDEGKILIWNGGANAEAVYPHVGASIGSGATNAPVTVAAGAFSRFYYVASNLWLQA